MDHLFQPHLSTTGIGSLPFADADEAATFVLDAELSMPFWPQLPARRFPEGMIPQYSEGMPCLRLDAEGESIRFDPSDKPSELEAFYGRFLEEDPSLFAISQDLAAGLYAFERLAAGRTWPFVKGHTTGPITFSTGVYDAQRTPLYSDPELRDAAVKAIVRKVEWQIGQLKRFASAGVVIFVDEPTLAAYGSSAYIYLSEENVHELLGEVFGAITAAGAIPGIHVCGNSDWGMLARSGVRIINFDAYQYGTTVGLYPADVARFLDNGGCIAWGIVPTSEAAGQETADSLAERLETCFEALTRKGIDRDLVREQSLLTPSCGAGTMSPDDARRVFRLLKELREKSLAAES